MITEPATVLRVADGVAWVSCHNQTGCPRCAAGRGCGGDVLGRLLGDRLREVQVRAGEYRLQRGDEVLIGVAERSLLASSVVMYLVPLLSMLAGALLVVWLLPASGDAGAIVGSAVGLLAGLAVARAYGRSRRADDRFGPRIIGRLSGETRQALTPGGQAVVRR